MAINLKVRTSFDISQGSTQLKNAIKQIQNNTNLKLNVDTSQLNGVVTKFTEIKNSSGDVTKKITDITNGIGLTQRVTEALNSKTKEWQKTISDVTNYQRMSDEQLKQQTQLYNQLLQLQREEFNIKQQMSASNSKNNDELQKELQTQLQINQARQNSLNSNIRNNGLVNYEREAQVLSQIVGLEQQASVKEAQRSQAEQQVNAKLQEQLTIFQRMANVRLDSIDKRYGNISGMSEKISRLRQEFSGLRVENGQLVDSTGKVVSSLADCRSRLSELGGVARNSTGIFSNLKDNISKFLQFYVGAGGILKAFESIKSAISYTNEMNAAMTNVRIITGQSAEQVENLTQKYIDLGKQLGMTSQDVSKVAEDYYRQGKSVSETNELIKTTGQMATLSGMQMEQATQGMTAILNGYKMNVSEASHVVDTLVSIDNNGATRCYLKRVA